MVSNLVGLALLSAGAFFVYDYYQPREAGSEGGVYDPIAEDSGKTITQSYHENI